VLTTGGLENSRKNTSVEAQFYKEQKVTPTGLEV